jgi:amino acid adenylation domain-containing protein
MSPDVRSIVPTVRDEHIPLSFAQQRLWLLDQVEPAPWAYNVVIARRLEGCVRADLVQRALDEVVARHEVLRTTYPTVDGHPEQRVRPPEPVELTVVELFDRPAPEAEAEALSRATTAARQPFDLVHGPVFRGALFRVSPEVALLVLTMHHIATDAWSEGLLLGEISDVYNALAHGRPLPLEPPRLQYADFALWQRSALAGDALETQLAYWRERLAGMPEFLEVPSELPRPARRSGRGESIPLQIPAELTAKLRQVTHAGRATLYMTLLAALQVLLARYSGEDDIVIGSPIANRTRPETATMLGFFANTMVLRTDLSGDPTFMEVLAQVREVAVGAYSNQDVPFEHLVKMLRPERSLGHTSLFQHMFVFQNAPGRDLDLDGTVVSDVVVEGDTAMFDLTLLLREVDDTLVGSLEYASDLYDRAAAERFVRHLRNLLEAIVTDPQSPVRALELLDDDERRQVLVDWNQTTVPLPSACVHTIFEQWARDRPDALALTDGESSVTYADMNNRANQLARHLQQLGVGPNVCVGICLPRSIDAVIALLATLKAGGAYLPLDPDYPATRLKFMIADAEVRVVVSRSTSRGHLDACDVTIVCLDAEADRQRIEAMSTANPQSPVTIDDLAYVVYTSGSTGEPKGVMVEHRAVIALLFGVDYVDFDEVDALLHMAPLSFDAATFEIWGALLHGHRCVVYPHRHVSLDRFCALVRSERVDTVWLAASLFNVVVDEDVTSLRGVRRLVVGGEALSPDHVARALQSLPGVRLVNGYGPTETTTFALCHEILVGDCERGSIPIGRPLANRQIYILDPSRRPVPPNVVGELYIGGAGLARGYLERPDLTAERFVAHPFDTDPGARLYKSGDLGRFRADGVVEFVGRIDDQLKIRGFRVEPGEIEAVLREHPDVAAAVVVARGNDAGRRHLVAYVATASRGRATKRELFEHLRARMPAHLVPSALVLLDALPLTATGKLDRAALPDAEDAQDLALYAAPTTDMEQSQAAIWSDVLGIERIGIDDNFFDLGGDSLSAALLFARTARQTGRDIPLALLFSGPTIREVARALEDETVGADTTIVPLQSAGSKPPLFVGHGVGGFLFRYSHLVRRLGADRPVYGLCPTDSMLRSTSRLRIEDLARRYVADIVRLRPTGPLCLAGFCFGGVLMIEVAHQLEEIGREVTVVALFDAEPSSTPPKSRARREAAQLLDVVRRRSSTRTYLRRRAANAKIKLRRWPWLASHWIHVRTGRPLSERWDDVARVQALHASPVQRTLGRALGTYVAPETRCPVATFRAGDPDASATHVRLLPGDDDTYIVDGPGVSHLTLMEEPFVGEIAPVLARLLDHA